MSNTTNSITRGILELARDDVTTLGEEMDNWSGIRVVSASKILAAMDMDESEVDPDELPSHLCEQFEREIGELGDEPDLDGNNHVPRFETYVRLFQAYGENWARLAHADYLTHFCDVPCREPYAVASAVWAQAEADYQDAKDEALAVAAA
jgi:hypothetical protein